MGLARVVGKVDDIDDVNTWARNKRNMHIHSHNTRATRSHPIDTFLRRAEHSRMPRGRAVQDRPAGHLHMYAVCYMCVCVCLCGCRIGHTVCSMIDVYDSNSDWTFATWTIH